jgi:hypothetical protein
VKQEDGALFVEVPFVAVDAEVHTILLSLFSLMSDTVLSMFFTSCSCVRKRKRPRCGLGAHFSHEAKNMRTKYKVHPKLVDV